jgi:hypothetical protein
MAHICPVVCTLLLQEEEAPVPVPKKKNNKKKKAAAAAVKEEDITQKQIGEQLVDHSEDGWEVAAPVKKVKAKKVKEEVAVSAAAAAAPAPVVEEWATVDKKVKAAKPAKSTEKAAADGTLSRNQAKKQEAARREAKPAVTLNNKGKKLKNQLISYYTAKGPDFRSKVSDFESGYNDDLCAHFAQEPDSLNSYLEKKYGTHLKSEAA